MKILHVNKYYSPEGGLEQYMLLLCQELENQGHENIIVYGERRKTSISHGRKSLLLPQITDYDCPDIISQIDELKRLIAQENPDIIFIHQVLNPKLIDFLAKAKPTLRFAHGYKLVCPTGRKVLKNINQICKYSLSKLCQIRAYQYRCMPRNPRLGLGLINAYQQIAATHKKHSHLMVASQHMKNVLVANGFQADKIAVIPYFTHLSEIAESTTSDYRGPILCVSRLVPGKGIDYLLTAFSLMEGAAELIIIGDGPSMAQLQEKTETLGLSSRVVFTGWLDEQQIDKFYQQASVVVLPSTWPEPFGIVGIEAMAHEKPVVAFDVGGISEWLTDGQTGYLVNRCDTSKLAERISYLLEHEQEATKLGRRGRQIVEQKFTKEIHIKKLLALMENIIHAQT